MPLLLGAVALPLLLGVVALPLLLGVVALPLLLGAVALLLLLGAVALPLSLPVVANALKGEPWLPLLLHAVKPNKAAQANAVSFIFFMVEKFLGN